MPHRLSLVLLLAVFALAACGGDDGNGHADEPQSKRRGVELILDREYASPGETLRLTVANHTRTRLEYGLDYRLEHFVDGQWRWINRDSVFAAILKVAEPGKREREEIRLPNDLPPGRYRIVKSFRAPARDKELEATVEFTVG